jgi:DNA replication protein DnaC
MAHLHQKLNQLTLTTMSRQLDQIASDAAAKNLSFSQALESLADLELESRNQNAIERRFRLSRLRSRHSIDGFNFKHHKSRMEIKARVARLWGNILHHTTIATAIADRLVENSEIFLLGGDRVRKLKHSPPPAE